MKSTLSKSSESARLCRVKRTLTSLISQEELCVLVSQERLRHWQGKRTYTLSKSNESARLCLVKRTLTSLVSHEELCVLVSQEELNSEKSSGSPSFSSQEDLNVIDKSRGTVRNGNVLRDS
jgi:hypothetical protein